MASERSFGEVHFGAARLGNKARTRRLVMLADQLTRHPSGILPQKLRNPAALQATYRLMNCDEVTHAAVLAPHRDETLCRIAEHNGPLLVICDGTELDYTTITSLQSLGKIGNGQRPRRGTHLSALKGQCPLTDRRTSRVSAHSGPGGARILVCGFSDCCQTVSATDPSCHRARKKPDVAVTPGFEKLRSDPGPSVNSAALLLKRAALCILGMTAPAGRRRYLVIAVCLSKSTSKSTLPVSSLLSELNAVVGD